MTNQRFRRIAVFCGASSGNDPRFSEIAQYCGKLLAKENIELVYGGGKVGLMGVVADAVLSAGGKVIGVIPDFLYSMEVGHDGVTELIKVNSMHERKLMMHELSDAVITLPGGFGTMEELFEMLTWAQLGLHAKPIGLLNAFGFYEHLIHLADDMVSQGFLRSAYREMLIDSDTSEDLLIKLSAVKPIVPVSGIADAQT